eukprot:5603168-Prymnesium_polylepis.1
MTESINLFHAASPGSRYGFKVDGMNVVKSRWVIKFTINDDGSVKISQVSACSVRIWAGSYGRCALQGAPSPSACRTVC